MRNIELGGKDAAKDGRELHLESEMLSAAIFLSFFLSFLSPSLLSICFASFVLANRNMARITILQFVSLVALALPTVSASTAASFLPAQLAVDKQQLFLAPQATSIYSSVVPMEGFTQLRKALETLTSAHPM